MPPKAPPAATAAGTAPKTPATPEKSDGVAATTNPEDDVSVRSGTFSFSDGAKYSYDHVAMGRHIYIDLHADADCCAVCTVEGEFMAVGGKMVRHGIGTFVNGPESYEGQWESDQMHGRGVYYFATGARYEGEFQGNVFHGAGVYQWPDGASYDGAWHASRMHGDGAYVDKDGVAWRGRFFNGKYNNGHIFHTLR